MTGLDGNVNSEVRWCETRWQEMAMVIEVNDSIWLDSYVNGETRWQEVAELDSQR